MTVLVPPVLSRLLICASVPVIVTVEVPLFDTVAPLPPAVTVNIPSPTDNVTVSLLEPPSTSLTANPLFLRSKFVCRWGAETGRPDGRHRSVVHRGDIDGGGVAAGFRSASAAIAGVVDR